MATVGRTDEIARCLRSLEAQSFRAFRLLVVDQNVDDRLVPLLAEFEHAFPILRLCSRPGVSQARNSALPHVRGEIVAFPDDDCWYPPDLLERVTEILAAHPEWDGLGARPVDELGRPATGGAHAEPGPMTLYNLWARVGTYSIFLRRPVLDAVGPFDQTLGPGAGTPWLAGEDLDYVARVIRAGRRVFYDPSLVVHHPQKREHSSRPDARQGYEYGAGFGRALWKNRLPWWFATYCVVRSGGAALLNLLALRPARARFYLAVARGRVRGWRGERAAGA